jgi:hypothetical protein
MRGDFDAANELLSNIPESEYTKVARFLESQGFKEEAFAVTTDPDHKFDLALELGQTETAHQLLLETRVHQAEGTKILQMDVQVRKEIQRIIGAFEDQGAIETFRMLVKGNLVLAPGRIAALTFRASPAY